MSIEAFVARQPIFTRDREVYGYELLFRSGPQNVFGSVNGDVATNSLISDLVHVHGLKSLTGGGNCFVNLTRQALIEEVYSVLPSEGTVVEILETVEPDDEVLDACARVRKAGYRLALDDYVLDPKFEPLLKLLDILKVEYGLLTKQEQQEVLALQRRHGFELLAEKVEEPVDFQEAFGLGYNLFQGYFFCKPEMVQSRRLPASRLNYLRFLQAINQDETDVSEVEKLIRQEVSLSYKLLRYLNSAAFGLRGGVKSIRHAITLLGQRPLRKWASLVAVSEMTDEKPAELMNTCLVRAKCCELLGERRPAGALSADLFMLGMFSLLDAMLDRPIDELVNELALPNEIRTALTDESAELRQFIELLIGFERGNWEAIARAVQMLGIRSDAVYQCYRDALVWSHEIMRELNGTNKSTSTETKAA